MMTRPIRTALVFGVAFCIAALDQARAVDDQPRKYLRFEFRDQLYYGYLIGETIYELDRDFLDGGVETGRSINIAGVRLLAPVAPARVIRLAENYGSEGGEPAIESKPARALAGPEDDLPAAAASMHYGGEMVVVIGETAHNVSEADALRHVFGVTIANDLTAPDCPVHPFHGQRREAQTAATPLGPWIVPGLDYDNLRLETRLNGTRVQRGSTRRMTHDVAALVSHLSTMMTLEPGDVIFTGTPASTGPVGAGDTVEVQLEGVGILANTVSPAER